MHRLLIGSLVALSAAAQSRVDPARVTRLLNRAIVIDLHDDTTQLILDEHYNLAERHTYAQVDIPRMRDGRVSALFFSIWTDSERFTPTEAIRRSLEQIDAVRRETARHPSDMVLATTAADIVAAHQRGRIAALIGVEGGHAIDSDLGILRTYFDLGARYMTLTHTTATPWAGSSGKPADHDGLTAFGREVVREMNRLGMMVDISHVSDKTFYDTLGTTTAPVIASHSSCRALESNPRNMTDDMLRAVAKNGGVVHINYYEGFLDLNFEAREKALMAERKQEDPEARVPKFGDRSSAGPEERKTAAEVVAKLGRIPLKELIDHFDHAIKVAGIDHVGLGSDFDGVGGQLPEGMEDISKIPNLVRGLMERGYSDEDILKVLGGNTLRVMRAVEKAAAH